MWRRKTKNKKKRYVTSLERRSALTLRDLRYLRQTLGMNRSGTKWNMKQKHNETILMTQCLKSKATKLRYRFLRVDEQWRQCYQLMIHLENRPSLRKRSEIFNNRKRVGCGKPSPKNLIFRFSLRLCRKSARQTIHRQRLFCHSTIQVQGVSSKSYFNRDVAYFFYAQVSARLGQTPTLLASRPFPS